MTFGIMVAVVYGGFFGGFFYFSYLSWKQENRSKKNTSKDTVQKVTERAPLAETEVKE